MVGIDLGEYAIKIAEISRRGKRFAVKNYAWAKTPESVKHSEDNAARAIRQMMDEAGIKTKKAFFTIPDTLYLCTSFELPPMPEKEIAPAIAYNASRYLTVPIADVAIDWQAAQPVREGQPIRIFAAAVPHAVVERYRSIAKKAGLEIIAVEAEALSIASNLGVSSARTACIVDAGAKSSTISIVDRGMVKESYTFIHDNKPLAQTIASHINDVDEKFFNREKKHVEEIYLTGGNAASPGLKEAVAQSVRKPVTLQNCFALVSYPVRIAPAISEINPLFAGAVGAALNGLKL